MTKVSDENDRIVVVSLPGFDASTADPENCAFHAGFPQMMVSEDLDGYVDYTSPSLIEPDTTYTVATINHNLGYVPEFHVFAEFQSSERDLFAELPLDYLGSSVTYKCGADDDNLKILLVNGPNEYTDTHTDQDFRFRYQIFVNEV